MLLLKTSGDTLNQVVANEKHASYSVPKNIECGDIILISQTKHTLGRNEKSIRYIMQFDSCYEDIKNESDRLWGRHWNYIIKGYNVRSVEPFDLEEIQVSGKNYGPIVTHCSLLEEDEKEVMQKLGI